VLCIVGELFYERFRCVGACKFMCHAAQLS
jgi:hypothetical protein